MGDGEQKSVGGEAAADPTAAAKAKAPAEAATTAAAAAEAAAAAARDKKFRRRPGASDLGVSVGVSAAAASRVPGGVVRAEPPQHSPPTLRRVIGCRGGGGSDDAPVVCRR